MMEMAMVSYNKIQMQYQIYHNNKKIIWLSQLLQKPTYLFATTLIGGNFFLQIGSESSRLLYQNFHMPANCAIFTQIICVVLCAELIPLFSARKYPEYIVQKGIVPIYIFSKILYPCVWILNIICQCIDKIVGKTALPINYLTREELQKAIEVKDNLHGMVQPDYLDFLIHSIFDLKMKSVLDLMQPINTESHCFSCKENVKTILLSLKMQQVAYMPIFEEQKRHIIGILRTKDLLFLQPHQSIQSIVISPWFVTENISLLDILVQFYQNHKKPAFVVHADGHVMGLLLWSSIVEEIFSAEAEIYQEANIFVCKSFAANTPVSSVNHILGIFLPCSRGETLEALMTSALGHVPNKRESVHISRFELTLEDSPALADKKITIKSL